MVLEKEEINRPMKWDEKKKTQKLNDENTQLAFVKGPNEYHGAKAAFKICAESIGHPSTA